MFECNVVAYMNDTSNQVVTSICEDCCLCLLSMVRTCYPIYIEISFILPLDFIWSSCFPLLYSQFSIDRCKIMSTWPWPVLPRNHMLNDSEGFVSAIIYDHSTTPYHHHLTLRIAICITYCVKLCKGMGLIKSTSFQLIHWLNSAAAFMCDMKTMASELSVSSF